MFIVSFRCVDAEAYEVKRDDVSNGIFISFLKRRVCEDEKVTVMLDRVAEGVYAIQKVDFHWADRLGGSNIAWEHGRKMFEMIM